MKEIFVTNPTTLEFNGNTYNVVHSYEEAMLHLANNESVMHYESGDSMFPILKNMEYGLMTPATEAEIGDAVFCRLILTDEMKTFGWDGLMTHRVIDKVIVEGEAPYYLIGSTSGGIYGWSQEIIATVHTTRIFENATIKIEE